jgi:hypothetical protein
MERRNLERVEPGAAVRAAELASRAEAIVSERTPGVLRPSEKAAVTASFLITSALGAWLIARPRAGKGPDLVHLIRSLAFPGIMGAVHLIGVHLYRRQGLLAAGAGQGPEEQPAPTTGSSPPAIAAEYLRALRSAVVQQVVTLTLCAMMLDFGQSLRRALVAAIAHWSAIALIVARRPSRPGRFDVPAIAYGFLPVALLVGLLAPLVQRFAGR